MTTQQNKEIARDFFTRFSAGDISGAVGLMAPEATWWIAGKRDSMPPAGMYSREEITRLFLRMVRRLKNGLNMTVKGAIAEGDTVALEVESLGELDNGRSYNNEYHTLMRLEGGKIIEVREYSDTQHAYDVWLKP